MGPHGRHLLPAVGLGFSLGLGWAVDPVRVVVNSEGDEGPGSLREVLHQVNQLGAGDVDLSGMAGKAIGLQSELPRVISNIRFLGPLASEVTLDGQGKHPILSFEVGTTGEVVRVVFRQALASGYRHGSAVSNAEAILLRECRFESNRNHSGLGGAVFNRGDITLQDYVFSGHSAVGEAGGDSSAGRMGFGPGGDAAGWGGAVFQEEGRLSAVGCIFRENRTTGGAGGAWGEDFAGSGRGGGPEGGGFATAASAGGHAGFGSGGGGAGVGWDRPFRRDLRRATAVRSVPFVPGGTCGV